MENSKKYKIYKIWIVVIIVIILGFVYKSFFISDQEKITDNWKIVNNNDKDDNKLFNDGQFEQTIKDYEKKWTWSLEREEKMKLVYSYLNFWNYFYKEEENSKKAMDILSTMDENWEVLYYKWYANEIIKDYTGSLDYYFKWLEIKELTPENKSLLLNQVGHLYDLKWEGDKVLYYYEEAYKLNDKNDSVLSNLWRYYAINWDYEKAYEFLNKALALTNNLPMKGELNFSLSSIELVKNWLNPDIVKSF